MKLEDLRNRQEKKFGEHLTLKEALRVGHSFKNDSHGDEGELCYDIARHVADMILAPMCWNELPDTNSLWNAVEMSDDFVAFVGCVEELCEERLNGIMT